MNRGLTLISGLGIGAGLMYLFDPQRGRRRRAQLRNQLRSAAGRIDDCLNMTARDLRQRAQGLFAEIRSWTVAQEIPDEVLIARLRSKLGRYVSHPSSIAITADHGRVTLHGPILAHEVEAFLEAIAAQPGVIQIDNRLERHRQPDNISALQGGVARPGERFELMQANWAPATRLLMGSAGLGLVAYGLTQRFPTACVLGTVGLGLLARGLSNRGLRQLVGFGQGRRLIEIRKTITVAAPVERVFDYWSRYENFPRFMAHVHDVKTAAGSDRSHWVVAGPAGIPIEWDTVITRFVPNQMLAWKTLPGSPVAHAGIVSFQPEVGRRTRIDLRMSYNPPAGALGHAVAALFSSDPKRALDDDLMRFKSLIELGKTTAHGERVTCEDLPGVAEQEFATTLVRS
jgi:uncharacterized membrane protein